MQALQEEICINCEQHPALHSTEHQILILTPSGEAYLTQMPFFQGLYDLPDAGAITPNYTLDLLGDYAATRCKSPITENRCLPL